MYHAHFRGTHYEAGFRWGSLLLKHKNIILENIPFEITQERIDYALSCLPIYEKYYHEIMEEIQGLADGQQCDVRILQAALFSMYSMPPSCNCSCFAFTTEGLLQIIQGTLRFPCGRNQLPFLDLPSETPCIAMFPADKLKYL